MKRLFKRLIIPLSAIDTALPDKGVIVDLGCGEGIISKKLSQNSKRKILGIDMDKNKIARAKKNARSNEKYRVGNIISIFLPKKISGFVIADVLHHLSRVDQKKVLARMIKHIERKGMILIKEINAHDVIRSKLSRIWDYLYYPQDQINYLSSTEITEYMEKAGFKVKHTKKRLFTPTSVHVFVCTKL